MITVTINGQEITLDREMSVLDAARQARIKIPTLCNHELLKPYGGCRLCVVEVERMPKLQNSCALLASDGMVVRTESEEIANVRRGILEFLLINHPLDCPYCDKAGECDLQDLTNKYGATAGRFTEEKRKVPESHKDQILTRHMGRCVVCTRCVRMCRDVQGASAITMVGRGGRTKMEPFSSESFNCEYCGNCLTVCPVGAILSRTSLHSLRPWQVDKEVATICPFCGVGCTLNVQVRDNSIQRVMPKLGVGVNEGLLCSMGRFGYDFAGSPDRLDTPLVRKNGTLQKTTWSEAIGLVAEKLAEIKKAEGGNAIAGIASARCTNEDNYVFQKFIRASCGSNNIDSIARTGYAAAQKYFEEILGQGVSANMLQDLKNSETILVLGGDPTAVNPVLGLAIREAAQRGAQVIVLGNAAGLKRFATLRIEPPLFREADMLTALLKEVYGYKGDRGEREALDRAIKDGISDVSYSSSLDTVKGILVESESISVVLGMDLVQRSDGHRALFALAGLIYLLEARLYLLSERPNEQGLRDVGCVPALLPGERPVTISDFRRSFESVWDCTLPEEEGLTLMEIVKGAQDGAIHALYVMGENPVINLPNQKLIRESLASLDFLVVQDIFLTETAELADVVLPASGWSEKRGTFTNLERRIQYLNRAVDSSHGLDDWKIIADVSCKMGYEIDYSSEDDIMREIAGVSPLYRDLSYSEIRKGKCLWPYHGQPLRGEARELVTADVEKRDFTGGPFIAVDRPLFHSGTITRKSDALNRVCPEPLVRINPELAGQIGCDNGDDVTVSTSSGSVNAKIYFDSSIKNDKVLLNNHFEGNGVFSILDYTIDPVTKAPGIEGVRAEIKKISQRNR
jgi:NADH-quinone oxidoreductase chain G